MLKIVQNRVSMLHGPLSEYSAWPVEKRRMLSSKPVRFLMDMFNLILADVCGLIIGGVLGFCLQLTLGGQLYPQWIVAMPFLYFAVAFYGGSYTPVLLGNAVDSSRRALMALSVTFFITVVISAVFGQSVISTLAGSSPIVMGMIVGVVVARHSVAVLVKKRRPGGLCVTGALLLVDGDWPDIEMSGATVIHVQSAGLTPDCSDPSAMEKLGQLVAVADRIVVACAEERRALWADAFRGANVRVDVLAEEIGTLTPLGMGQLAGRTTIQVTAEPLGYGDRVIKRLFDIAFATVALFVLAPVMILIAIAIKCDSKGPIFFRQPRLGRGNSLFLMHKFRSMRVEVQDLQGSKLTTGRNDDRVTRVGRFIRATSIDELPQLIDVLLGHMSIVGPRPHALGAKAGSKLYWEVDSAYWHRHAVKPGITGLAQVRGYRGTTFVDADLQNRLSADLEYVRKWSLARDILIVCRTVMALTGRSAF